VTPCIDGVMISGTVLRSYKVRDKDEERGLAKEWATKSSHPRVPLSLLHDRLVETHSLRGPHIKGRLRISVPHDKVTDAERTMRK
jgi:hypothetical protein